MAAHPYQTLASPHFWNRSVAGRRLADIDYDPAPKFRFQLTEDRFATAGSCFARHFGRTLVQRGGQLFLAETRHPLIPKTAGHGYGIFSARYGNLYNTRQLRELVDQALGKVPPICEFARRADGRWIDMLRPRAVPDGFTSEEEARVDRLYHLRRVRHLLQSCSVFVFTLGLTEMWRNKRAGYSYGICPGVIAGAFAAAEHEFKNLSFRECVADLAAVFEAIYTLNPRIKVLLTVSPVMLVATAEARGVLQSSTASKAILRAVADECVRYVAFVDYFPSYEIITGPQATGRFFDHNLREVREEGVQLVMDMFFKSRILGSGQPARPAMPIATATDFHSNTAEIVEAIQAECDEIFLNPQ